MFFILANVAQSAITMKTTPYEPDTDEKTGAIMKACSSSSSSSSYDNNNDNNIEGDNNEVTPVVVMANMYDTMFRLNINIVSTADVDAIFPAVNDTICCYRDEDK